MWGGIGAGAVGGGSVWRQGERQGGNKRDER